MGSVEDIDFGPDTDAIRRWLAKRATYAGEMGDPVGGGKHRVDPLSTVNPQDVAVPSTRDAEREVLDALAEPAPPAAQDWPAAAGTTPEGLRTYPTPPPRKIPQKRQGPRTPFSELAAEEEQDTSSRSTNVVFKPRRGAQHAVTATLLLAGAAAVVAGYVAYREQTTLTYGVAGLLAVLALAVWAVRVSTTATELAVIRGQLEIIRGGRFEVIDLASPFTPVLVEGRPGSRGWQVLIERADQPLLVLDRSVVDPEEFMAVLLRIRPDLRP